MLHLMASIRACRDGSPTRLDDPSAALSSIQEAVAIFRETGSRHLAEAEKTLQAIQECLNEQERAEQRRNA